MPRKKKEEETPEEKPVEESGFMEKEPAPDEEVVIDTAAESEEEETSPSRADKKRQRRDRLVEESRAEAEQYKAELERQRQESQEIRERLARMEGRMESQSKGDDPIAVREKEIKKELRSIATYLSKEGLTQEEIDSQSEKAWGLQKELSGLWVKSHQADAQRNQPPPPNPRQVMLQMQYADVFNSAEARDYYMEHYFRRKRELRIPASQPVPENVLVECLDYARKMASVGYTPSEADKRRLSAGPVGGSDSGTKTDTKVTMGPRQRMMADATYKSVKDPNERYRLWAENYQKQKKTGQV